MVRVDIGLQGNTISPKIYRYLKHITSGYSEYEKKVILTFTEFPFYAFANMDIDGYSNKGEKLPSNLIIPCIRFPHDRTFHVLGTLFYFKEYKETKKPKFAKDIAECMKLYILALQNAKLDVIATVAPFNDTFSLAVQTLLRIPHIDDFSGLMYYHVGRSKVHHIHDPAYLKNSFADFFLKTDIECIVKTVKYRASILDIHDCFKVRKLPLLQEQLVTEPFEPLKSITRYYLNSDVVRDIEHYITYDMLPHKCFGTAVFIRMFLQIYEVFYSNSAESLYTDDYEEIIQEHIHFLYSLKPIDTHPVISEPKSSSEPMKPKSKSVRNLKDIDSYIEKEKPDKENNEESVPTTPVEAKKGKKKKTHAIPSGVKHELIKKAAAQASNVTTPTKKETVVGKCETFATPNSKKRNPKSQAIKDSSTDRMNTSSEPPRKQEKTGDDLCKQLQNKLKEGEENSRQNEIDSSITQIHDTTRAKTSKKSKNKKKKRNTNSFSSSESSNVQKFEPECSFSDTTFDVNTKNRDVNGKKGIQIPNLIDHELQIEEENAAKIPLSVEDFETASSERNTSVDKITAESSKTKIEDQIYTETYELLENMTINDPKNEKIENEVEIQELNDSEYLEETEIQQQNIDAFFTAENPGRTSMASTLAEEYNNKINAEYHSIRDAERTKEMLEKQVKENAESLSKLMNQLQLSDNIYDIMESIENFIIPNTSGSENEMITGSDNDNDENEHTNAAEIARSESVLPSVDIITQDNCHKNINEKSNIQDGEPSEKTHIGMETNDQPTSLRDKNEDNAARVMAGILQNFKFDEVAPTSNIEDNSETKIRQDNETIEIPDLAEKFDADVSETKNLEIDESNIASENKSVLNDFPDLVEESKTISSELYDGSKNETADRKDIDSDKKPELVDETNIITSELCDINEYERTEENDIELKEKPELDAETNTSELSDKNENKKTYEKDIGSDEIPELVENFGSNTSKLSDRNEYKRADEKNIDSKEIPELVQETKIITSEPSDKNKNGRADEKDIDLDKIPDSVGDSETNISEISDTNKNEKPDEKDSKVDGIPELVEDSETNKSVLSDTNKTVLSDTNKNERAGEKDIDSDEIPEMVDDFETNKSELSDKNKYERVDEKDFDSNELPELVDEFETITSELSDTNVNERADKNDIDSEEIPELVDDSVSNISELSDKDKYERADEKDSDSDEIPELIEDSEIITSELSDRNKNRRSDKIDIDSEEIPELVDDSETKVSQKNESSDVSDDEIPELVDDSGPSTSCVFEIGRRKYRNSNITEPTMDVPPKFRGVIDCVKEVFGTENNGNKIINERPKKNARRMMNVRRNNNGQVIIKPIEADKIRPPPKDLFTINEEVALEPSEEATANYLRRDMQEKNYMEEPPPRIAKNSSESTDYQLYDSKYVESGVQKYIDDYISRNGCGSNDSSTEAIEEEVTPEEMEDIQSSGNFRELVNNVTSFILEVIRKYNLNLDVSRSLEKVNDRCLELYISRKRNEKAAGYQLMRPYAKLVCSLLHPDILEYEEMKTEIEQTVEIIDHIITEKIEPETNRYLKERAQSCRRIRNFWLSNTLTIRHVFDQLRKLHGCGDLYPDLFKTDHVYKLMEYISEKRNNPDSYVHDCDCCEPLNIRECFDNLKPRGSVLLFE